MAQVRSGRRVDNKPNVRDVFSFVVQSQHGFSLESLELVETDEWYEALVDKGDLK